METAGSLQTIKNPKIIFTHGTYSNSITYSVFFVQYTKNYQKSRQATIKCEHSSSTNCSDILQAF
jgi:hypothetical protein